MQMTNNASYRKVNRLAILTASDIRNMFFHIWSIKVCITNKNLSKEKRYFC